jgi:hypothetical protein
VTKGPDFQSHQTVLSQLLSRFGNKAPLNS